MNKFRRTGVQNILNGQKCDLHNYLRWHMTFLRWAGVFPVDGLEKPTVQCLKFRLKSFYGIYYFASLFGQTAITTSCAIWCFSAQNYSASPVTILILNSTALLIMIELLKLANRWPILLKRVTKIEYQLRNIRRSNNVQKHCNYLLWFVTIVSFVENSLSLLFFYKSLWKCNLLRKFTPDLFQYFCKHIAPFVFKYTTFSLWKVILYKLLTIQTIVLWGVTDVLPMCASLYLLSYFRDLNAAIKIRATKNPKFWEKHRMHFTRLGSLVTLIDEHFKTIVLFSFFNYLYFISAQLFFFLNTDTVKYKECDTADLADSTERLLFYLFSIACLISRALTMSLLAASVHIEAQKPLLSLHDIPKEEENKEIQRFRLQLVYNPVSLTGSFFSITRSSILKFISTIITYELVLLQLNKNRKSNMFLMDEFTESIQNGTLHL